jgi:hypothetical protein
MPHFQDFSVGIKDASNAEKRFSKNLFLSNFNEDSVHLYYIGCSFKFILKVGGEESIMDYKSRTSCLNLTSLFALFVFLLCRLTTDE